MTHVEAFNRVRKRVKQCMGEEDTDKIPKAAHLTLCSRFASSKMIVGLLPPSSSVTTLRFDSEDALRILRPVNVLPVNATFAISGWWEMASPTVWPGKADKQWGCNEMTTDLPYPLTMLTTPGGKPASVMRSAIRKAARGVISDG